MGPATAKLADSAVAIAAVVLLAGLEPSAHAALEEAVAAVKQAIGPNAAVEGSIAKVADDEGKKVVVAVYSEKDAENLSFSLVRRPPTPSTEPKEAELVE